MTALLNITYRRSIRLRLSSFVMAQLMVSLSRRAVPYRIVFFFLCWTIISIFFHFIQFLETAAGGEVDRMLIFISSFHFLPTQQSILRAALLAGPARRFSSPPPAPVAVAP